MNMKDLMQDLINSLHLTKWQRKRIVWRVRWEMWKSRRYLKEKKK